MINKEIEFLIDVQSKVKGFAISNSNHSKINPFKLLLNNFYRISFSILDFNLLILRLIFNFSKSYNFVYTGEGICLKVQGQYRDRILENLALENIIYINRGRDTIIKSINGIKTYNIGGVVKLLTFVLKFTNKKRFSTYYAYKIVNNSILKFAKNPKVFSLLYYNLNGLSLVFSKHRSKIQLIEVQHGAIINFPAYSEPSEIKIADIFYVKNQGTINYLKERLNKNFKDIEYRMLPYPKRETEFKEGTHILYASTVEFNGIHPVFMEYLTELTQDDKVTVYIRLHPREKNKKEVFENQLKNIKSNIIFDESKNWLESNTVKNLVVVSPWSSVIEDAVDNGYRAIIIDVVGKERFNYLIDNKNVIFADNLKKILLSV